MESCRMLTIFKNNNSVLLPAFETESLRRYRQQHMQGSMPPKQWEIKSPGAVGRIWRWLATIQVSHFLANSSIDTSWASIQESQPSIKLSITWRICSQTSLSQWPLCIACSALVLPRVSPRRPIQSIPSIAPTKTAAGVKSLLHLGSSKSECPKYPGDCIHKPNRANTNLVRQHASTTP